MSNQNKTNNSMMVKFLTPIITVALLIIIAAFLYFATIKANQEKMVFQDSVNKAHLNVDLLIAQKTDVWLTNALQIAINQNLIDAVKSNDRNAIKEVIAGIGKDFKDNTSFKNVNVQIITPDLKSLLKSWKFESFGESVTYSDVFTEAIKTGKPITSLEESPSKGLRIKSAYPIKDGGKVIGLVDFEGGINNFAKVLKQQNIEFLYFIDDKFKAKGKKLQNYYLQSKSYIDEKFLNTLFNDKELKNIDKLIQNKSFYANEKYFMVPVNLNDFKGTKIGMAILAYHKKDIEAQIENVNTLADNAILIMLGITAILLIVILISLKLFVLKPIGKTVEAILKSNNQLVSASSEIASSSADLADGASRQASSVEEVSATIEESTSINVQNAENTRQADLLAKETKDAAEVGYQKGTELMNAMTEINASSEKISKIIKTIDEIASQTKLLALNAAVEAARAGEHGLGFAVVADEVKSLAGRSAEAAAETANIIEESINQAKNGSQISEQTNEAFDNILDKIKKTSNIIGEISISAKEQSEGMSQISSAMNEIDQITQQNAATSEQAAASAEQLNAQAIAMQEIVKSIGVKYNEEEANNTQ